MSRQTPSAQPASAQPSNQYSTGDATLAGYRKSIDNIDAALIHMLAERFRITQAVGAYKAKIRAANMRRSPGCGLWHRMPSSTPNSARNSCASSSMR